MTKGAPMNESRNSPVEALRQAHQELLEDLQELERAANPGTREAPAQMHTRLDALREHLTEHFRFEEQDGYMDAVRQREPHREREINQLQEEHGQLAQSLDHLLAEVRGMSRLDDVFGEKVRAWVERVRHHEAHENRLVLRAFTQDVGTKD
jgi:hemerythrin-like domain-containing protein